LAHDQVLFAIDLDVTAGILPEQDPVAGLQVQRNDLAILEALALANRDYFAFLGLLFRGIRNIQAALHRFLLLDTPDDDAVVKRTNIHDLTSVIQFNGY